MGSTSKLQCWCGHWLLCITQDPCITNDPAQVGHMLPSHWESWLLAKLTLYFEASERKIQIEQPNARDFYQYGAWGLTCKTSNLLLQKLFPCYIAAEYAKLLALMKRLMLILLCSYIFRVKNSSHDRHVPVTVSICI